MKLARWLDDRTGLLSALRAAFHRPEPRHGRWRRVWQSTIAVLFLTQLATGLGLMATYSPATTTAWGSVWYIHTQLPAGWLVRSAHVVTTDVLVVVLILYLLHLLLTRAYGAPREFTWWIGMVLVLLTVGLSHTGYLLPWDQDGFWGTSVRTQILARTPLVGEALRRLLIGGPELGQATLTRFHTLHVFVLPACFLLLLAGQARLNTRLDDVTPPQPPGPDERCSCVAQGLRCVMTWLVVLAGIGVVCVYLHDTRGTALFDAPADPAGRDYPARPEWYFLFLFESLKYFTGPFWEVVGSVVIPGLALLLLAAVPLLPAVLGSRTAHRISVGLCTLFLASAAALTATALRADRNPSDAEVAAARARQAAGGSLAPGDARVLEARALHVRRQRARDVARRAIELAGEHGIPPQGPRALLDADPLTRGPELFARDCASCHRFHGHDGLGQVPAAPATSSDLGGYATRYWIRGLLANPMDDRYFGRMRTEEGEPAHTRMSIWIEETSDENCSERDRQALLENFDAVAAYLEDESLHPGRIADLVALPTNGTPAASDAVPDEHTRRLLTRGREFFLAECNECHSYRGARRGTRSAPEMFGYGSVEWIELMIAEPDHETRYRSVGRERALMPRFADRISAPENLQIAQWLHFTGRKND